jgi:hypothetical protein
VNDKIFVRDIFLLKFGRAKDAEELLKNGSSIAKKTGIRPTRAMTDLTGPSYTFVLEST